MGELAKPFAISLPAVSRHLRVLERARLIERRVDAQWRVCRLRPQSLRAAADWFDDYRRFWEESFDRLAEVLEEPKPGKEQMMTARDTFDLTVRRVIRAPRQKVFDAFIKPDLVRQWMGPRSFKVTALEIDPRAGGRYRVTMQHRAPATPRRSMERTRRSRRPSASCSHGNGRVSRWARSPRRS